MFGSLPLSTSGAFCGCWYITEAEGSIRSAYLPLTSIRSRTIIFSTASRTVLTQTFVNSSKSVHSNEIKYSFPLYDGVSVVSFTCILGDKKIVGRVKQKHQAQQDYQDAVSRGETAGLFSQLTEASDVFTTSLGNIPPDAKIEIQLVYLGELKHDVGADATRFSIPTIIAPRYGHLSTDLGHTPDAGTSLTSATKFTVDVNTDEGSHILQIQSPSHPISVTIGRTSETTGHDSFESNKGSATLSLDDTVLEKDFVILISTKDADVPKALLESHPTIPKQRCLMATLVPRFKLPQAFPEIVFLVDRSGSMSQSMKTVIRSLNVLLKSLPVGVKFNICSFGSRYDFLWPRSQTYNKTNLEDALKQVHSMSSNYGGTKIFQPVRAIVENRYKDMHLEVIMLTDGQIWNQQDLFDYISKSVASDPVRFFSLGIDSGASSSLVEGVAAAGNGFSQFVHAGEKLDKKMLRMLKGALTPHTTDYSLEILYENEDEGFEFLDGEKEKVPDPPALNLSDSPSAGTNKPISLFDRSINRDDDYYDNNPKQPHKAYGHLPDIATPSLLQVPFSIPPLFPFQRTVVYILLDPDKYHLQPTFAVLRGKSEHGPLELKIQIQDIGKGSTLHQLAAKKAAQEIERNWGWLADARDKEGRKLKDVYEGRWDEIVEREAVRLGIKYQVAGKWCSFIAVQEDAQGIKKEVPTSGILTNVALPERASHGHALAAPAFGSLDSAMLRPHVNNTYQNVVASAPSTARSVGPFGQTPANDAFRTSQLLGSFSSRSSGVNRISSSGGLFGGPQSGGGSFEQRSSSFAPGPTGYGTAAPPTQSIHAQPTSFSAAPASKISTSSLFGGESPNPERSSPRFRRKGAGRAGNDSIAPGGPSPLWGSRGDTYEQSRELPSLGENITELPKSDEEKMEALIDLQTFDGSWEWNHRLEQILDLGVVETKTDVTATAAAIAFFKIVVPQEKGTWELVVDKAMGWLTAKLGNGINAEEEVGKYTKFRSGGREAER